MRDRLDAREREGKPRSLAMGAVDCTTPKNQPLCREQFIQAFPTVRVYRKGKHAGGAKPGHEAAPHYEAYMGERSAEAVAAFASRVLAEVEANVLPTPHATDSKVHSRGCTLQGSVTVSRVPGELHIVPTSRGHSLHMENVNMTHVIEHLSFGAEVSMDLPEVMKRIAAQRAAPPGSTRAAPPGSVPADMARAPAAPATPC